MKDPLQFRLGNRDNDEIMLRPRQGSDMPLRAYNVTAAPEKEADDLAALMRYVWILWKHKWMLILAASLGMLASIAGILWMIPTYHAITTLEIQKIPQPFGQQLLTESSTDTQIQLLSSMMMRRRALSKITDKPATWEMQTKGPLAELRKLFRMKDPAKSISWAEAVDRASGAVYVAPDKQSDILIIQSDSPNPQATAAYVNTLAEEFILYTQEQRKESYQNSGSWMNQELQDMKSRIETAEQQKAQFAKDKGLIFTDATSGTSGTQTVGEEKLKGLQTELQIAQADLIKVQARSEATHPASGETLAAGMDSSYMGNLQSQLTELNAELERLRTTLTDKNDRIRELLNKKAVIEAAMGTEKKNIVSRDKSDIDAALNRVKKLQHDFEVESQTISKQSDDLIKYNIMARDIETNKRLYDTMQEQGKQASIASANRNSSARVVDAALVSSEPSRPNLPLMLVLGMMGGLGCGAGLVIVRSRMDLTIKDPGVLELELNVRELGVIPSARTDIQVRNLRAFSDPPSGKRPRSVDCLEMVTHRETPSVMAEAFRSAMTSLLFSSENGDQPRVLVFTSASPGEGKSTVVSNLAISLAQTNQRVLLVDADLRLPRAHAIFDVPNNFGLSDVLHERKPIEDYIEESLVRKTRVPNLYLLPAGPARVNMSRLMHSGRMKELMMRLRESFDIILIDTPPVLTVPDSRIFARAADAVVLVVRANQTHQKAAFAAANCFASDGTRILGTILNDWNPGMSSETYGGYYGHNGYNGYYPDK